MDEQTAEIIAVLKALDEDWAIVDEYPNEDFLVLVNESRMVMEGFFPKKALVQIMEDPNSLLKVRHFSRVDN